MLNGQTRDDQSIRERAYAHIQRKIASGELPPGSSVSELALSKELGSSRTPIREAIGQLVAEGLLEQVRNRGAVVVQLARQDIIDLYELREALEIYAVGKVAREPANRADLERLNGLTNEIIVLRDELERSGGAELNAQQMPRFVTCDLGFHTLLIRMASNARITKVLAETRLLIRIFAIHRQGHSAAQLERIHRYHSSVLKAVARRDPEAAMKSLSDHIKTSQKERLEEFDHWEREASLRESLPVFFDMHTTSQSR
jgi:DNA-binding GntR family transcriptional regulator